MTIQFGVLGFGKDPLSVFNQLLLWDENMSSKVMFVDVDTAPMTAKDFVQSVQAYDPKHPSYVEINGQRRRLHPATRDRIDGTFKAAIDVNGPAICIEINGSEKTRMKKKYGRAGSHARVFYFFGTAPNDKTISPKNSMNT